MGIFLTLEQWLLSDVQLSSTIFVTKNHLVLCYCQGDCRVASTSTFNDLDAENFTSKIDFKEMMILKRSKLFSQNLIEYMPKLVHRKIPKCNDRRWIGWAEMSEKSLSEASAYVSSKVSMVESAITTTAELSIQLMNAMKQVAMKYMLAVSSLVIRKTQLPFEPLPSRHQKIHF